MKFFIPVEPRTKKNSQRIVKINGYTKVLPSKAYAEFEKACKQYIPQEHIDYPINLKAVFFMKTRRRVDLVNLEEALCDVLVKHRCIADDNFNIVASMDGSYVDYNKNRPGIEVEIRRKNEVED